MIYTGHYYRGIFYKCPLFFFNYSHKLTCLDFSPFSVPDPKLAWKALTNVMAKHWDASSHRRYSINVHIYAEIRSISDVFESCQNLQNVISLSSSYKLLQHVEKCAFRAAVNFVSRIIKVWIQLSRVPISIPLIPILQPPPL